MEQLTSYTWKGFSASIPGSAHIRKDVPCQDASLVITGTRPAAIVCDGCGSSTHSQFGAQAAVKIFRTQIAILEPIISSILDCEKTVPEAWHSFCRIICRTLIQVKLELAEEYNLPEKEFDFTVAFAITGKKFIGCCQIGDGAIVLRQNNILLTAFKPDKGEFANQTVFLRSGGDAKGKFQSGIYPASENNGIAITSDGPAHLMFKLPEMLPGKIFDAMFNDLAKGDLDRQGILDYLTDRHWNDDPRGCDDRSLAIIVPETCKQKNVENPESYVDNGNFQESTPYVSENIEPSHQFNKTISNNQTQRKECVIMKKSICLMVVILLAATAVCGIICSNSTSQKPVSLENEMLQLVVNDTEPEGTLGNVKEMPYAKLPEVMRRECMDDTLKNVKVVEFDADNDGEKEWFVDYYGSHGNNSEGFTVFTKLNGKWQKCGELLGIKIAPMNHRGRPGIFQKYRCGGFTREYTFYELIDGKFVDSIIIKAERGDSEKLSILNIKVLSRSPHAFDHLF